MEYIIIASVLFFGFCILLIAKHFESKHYNKGICPDCNIKLRNFDMDSHGGRGYTCDICHYTTWCSYNVDKNHNSK